MKMNNHEFIQRLFLQAPDLIVTVAVLMWAINALRECTNDREETLDKLTEMIETLLSDKSHDKLK